MTPSGAHGTHVAAVAAAHHPERGGDLDGVAPGARIVSLKIGDARLGTLETLQSLTRASAAAARLGADVINLSYGESATLANHGRYGEVRERSLSLLRTFPL